MKFSLDVFLKTSKSKHPFDPNDINNSSYGMIPLSNISFHPYSKPIDY